MIYLGQNALSSPEKWDLRLPVKNRVKYTPGHTQSFAVTERTHSFFSLIFLRNCHKSTNFVLNKLSLLIVLKSFTSKRLGENVMRKDHVPKKIILVELVVVHTFLRAGMHVIYQND